MTLAQHISQMTYRQASATRARLGKLHGGRTAEGSNTFWMFRGLLTARIGELTQYGYVV